MQNETPEPGSRRRRQRYPGTHPRRFEHRYKEHQPEKYPGIQERVRERGGTPAGTHVPVLLAEVMDALQPAVGEIVADCTLGFGGHAQEFAARVGPEGCVHAFDVDCGQLERTRERLTHVASNISFHRSNFAGIAKVLQQEGLPGYDVIFADLGVSSMQIDDPTRGFSYKHDGPLDMRMDDRLPQSAADLLAKLPPEDLATAFHELADEPDASRIARAIVQQRDKRPIRRTFDLVRVIFDAKCMTLADWKHRPKGKQNDLHPAARTFQALRILVNDELGTLRNLLRVAPACLKPGGRLGIITFHSGEDRLVRRAFEDGYASGVYEFHTAEPIRPDSTERFNNPRSTSARFRWARRAPEAAS